MIARFQVRQFCLHLLHRADEVRNSLLLREPADEEHDRLARLRQGRP